MHHSGYWHLDSRATSCAMFSRLFVISLPLALSGGGLKGDERKMKADRVASPAQISSAWPRGISEARPRQTTRGNKRGAVIISPIIIKAKPGLIEREDGK